MPRLRLVLAAALALLCVSAGPPARAATPAAGFALTQVATLAVPTAIAPLADGRLLVGTKTGQVYLLENGVLRKTPVLDLSARLCTNGERGLLGLAGDTVASTGAIFVFYTQKGSAGGCADTTGLNPSTTAPVNRVARFTMRADGTIDPASQVLLMGRILSPNATHNAGDLHVGKDGDLYISTGDGECDYLGGVSVPGGSGCGGDNDATRDLNVLNGKILRITRSGGIPADNPYLGSNSVRCNVNSAPAGKVCQETFASGLRNPFRFAFDPNAAGTSFRINDVGQDAWEEIDQGRKGADYGWNTREGPCATTGSEANCGPAKPAAFTDPVYAYGHSTGCTSITGGAYVPNGLWPSAYTGGYVFGDYVCGKIMALSSSGARTDLVTGLGSSSAVAMTFGNDGTSQSLYFTSLAGGGAVFKVRYTGAANRAPTAVLRATPSAGPAPLAVTLDGSGSTDPDGDALTYTWTYGDGTTSTTTSTPKVSHTYAAGTWVAKLTVKDAKGAVSAASSVTIASGDRPPVPVITAPAAGATFVSGRTYALTGSATDPEDGSLPPASLSWTIVRRHDSHTHPFLGPVTGNNVSFVAPGPENLAAAANSDLTVTLTVKDSKGVKASVSRTFAPQRVAITLATSPAGRVVTVDGTSVAGPTTVTAWAGEALQVAVPSQTDASGVAWTFSRWSGGGAAAHTITAPTKATTYTATLAKVSSLPSAPTTVKATQTGPGEVTVTWAAPTSTGGQTITGYRVARDGNDATGAGPYATTVAASARTFTFKQLVVGHAYAFTIAAVTAAGNGAAGSAAVTVVALPSAPTDVKAAQATVGVPEVTVTWAPPTSTGGQTITGYRVTRDGSDATGAGPYAKVVTPDLRTFTFKQLVLGRTYTFTVQAVTASGTGPPAAAAVTLR